MPRFDHTTAGGHRIEDQRVFTQSFSYLFIYQAAQTDLSYELSQAGVAEQQPASGCDAVGFVLKLLRF